MNYAFLVFILWFDFLFIGFNLFFGVNGINESNGTAADIFMDGIEQVSIILLVVINGSFAIYAIKRIGVGRFVKYAFVATCLMLFLDLLAQ